MTKKQKAADYDTGYCKPPKATQFKKGRSGNPKGRPAKRQTVDALLREILNEPLTVTVAGREEHITALRGVLLRLRNKALEGDSRAIEKFLDKAERFCPEIVASEVKKTAGQDDIAIFRAAVARANRTTAEASTIAVGAAPGTASKTAPPSAPSVPDPNPGPQADDDSLAPPAVDQDREEGSACAVPTMCDGAEPGRTTDANIEPQSPTNPVTDNQSLHTPFARTSSARAARVEQHHRRLASIQPSPQGTVVRA